MDMGFVRVTYDRCVRAPHAASARVLSAMLHMGPLWCSHQRFLCVLPVKIVEDLGNLKFRWLILRNDRPVTSLRSQTSGHVGCREVLEQAFQVFCVFMVWIKNGMYKAKHIRKRSQESGTMVYSKVSSNHVFKTLPSTGAVSFLKRSFRELFVAGNILNLRFSLDLRLLTSFWFQSCTQIGQNLRKASAQRITNPFIFIRSKNSL